MPSRTAEELVLLRQALMVSHVGVTARMSRATEHEYVVAASADSGPAWCQFCGAPEDDAADVEPESEDSERTAAGERAAPRAATPSDEPESCPALTAVRSALGITL